MPKFWVHYYLQLVFLDTSLVVRKGGERHKIDGGTSREARVGKYNFKWKQEMVGPNEVKVDFLLY